MTRNHRRRLLLEVRVSLEKAYSERSSNDVFLCIDYHRSVDAKFANLNNLKILIQQQMHNAFTNLHYVIENFCNLIT